MNKIIYIKEISFIKTLYFNLKYFGFKGLKFPVLLSKKTKLQKVSGNIILKEYNFGDIKIGFSGVGIFDKNYQRTIYENIGEIVFEGKANIGVGSRIINAGKLEIGKQFNITAGTTIICYKKIKFGQNVLISWDNLIMDTDFHKVKSMESNEILNQDKEIEIKNNVWIGCRNTILKGTYIDNNSIVSTNSLVNSNFKDKTNIIIGDKNKIIKSKIYWEA